jgi:hypothetical protein
MSESSEIGIEETWMFLRLGGRFDPGPEEGEAENQESCAEKNGETPIETGRFVRSARARALRRTVLG